MDQVSQKSTIQSFPPLEFPITGKVPKQCFLVSKIWWDKLCKYIGYNTEESNTHPGLIDNNIIDVSDPSSFLYLPCQSWKLLKSVYGYTVKRKVFIVNNSPELHSIKTLVNFSNKELKTIRVPLALTLSSYVKIISKKFKIDYTQCKFYITHPSSYRTKLKNYCKTLQEYGFYEDIQVFFRKKHEENQLLSSNIIEEEIEDEDFQKNLAASMEKNHWPGPDLEKINELKSALSSNSPKVFLTVKSLKKIKNNLEMIQKLFNEDE